MSLTHPTYPSDDSKMAFQLMRYTGVWRRQADARPGSVGAGHRAAMRATMSQYTEWKVERLKLVIDGDGDGGVAGWRIGEWKESDG